MPKIANYGYTKNDLQYDACKNVAVGAWIISQNMAEGKTVWAGIANYHSRTPAYNIPYRKSIYTNYTQLNHAIT
ncbi:MAG: Conjugal transfer protein TrbN [uncultured bacterium]|nr:MAG: Conjugal transfer protein TrbN [uncultured bacterium]